MQADRGRLQRYEPITTWRTDRMQSLMQDMCSKPLRTPGLPIAVPVWLLTPKATKLMSVQGPSPTGSRKQLSIRNRC